MTDEKNQRQELKQALNEAGLFPRNFTARDGTEYIIVPLLDTRTEPITVATENPELRTYFRTAAGRWPHPAYLYICSGSPGIPFEVGIIGHNGETDEDYSPEEWSTARTVPEAVELYQKMWESRDTWLNHFVSDLS